MYDINTMVFRLLDTILEIYKWIIIISALLSFVNPDKKNPVIKFLRNLTEPVYSTIRSLVPTTYYNIDFAPLIVILVIHLLQSFILPIIFY